MRTARLVRVAHLWHWALINIHAEDDPSSRRATVAQVGSLLSRKIGDRPS
jgi:hypothetical protein